MLERVAVEAVSSGESQISCRERGKDPPEKRLGYEILMMTHTVFQSGGVEGCKSAGKMSLR